ncbi:MAG: hypothetical protein R3F34_19500 [Planctomycetota bacterium]
MNIDRLRGAASRVSAAAVDVLAVLVLPVASMGCAADRPNGLPGRVPVGQQWTHATDRDENALLPDPWPDPEGFAARLVLRDARTAAAEGSLPTLAGESRDVAAWSREVTAEIEGTRGEDSETARRARVDAERLVRLTSELASIVAAKRDDVRASVPTGLRVVSTKQRLHGLDASSGHAPTVESRVVVDHELVFDGGAIRRVHVTVGDLDGALALLSESDVLVAQLGRCVEPARSAEGRR